MSQRPRDPENEPDQSSQDEVAGGDARDVPGGVYNVPPGMADEVSEQDPLPDGRPQKPER